MAGEFDTKGKANLFYYADEDFKKHYFIQKDSQDIVELEYIVYSKGDNRFVEIPKYVEQLRNLLVECEKINIGEGLYFQEIDRVPFAFRF